MSNYTADQGQRSTSTTSQADYRRSAMVYIAQKEMGLSEEGKRHTRMHAHTCTHTHKGINTKGKEVEGLRVTLSNPVCLFHTESLCYTRQTHRGLSVLKSDHDEE